MGKGVIDVGEAKPYFAVVIFTVSLIIICSRNFKWMPIGRAATALVGSVNIKNNTINIPAEEIGSVVNWDTLILLMSMMMLCNYMERANVWDMASKMLLYKCRSSVEFMVRVCAISASMSAVLTNDTVCVTITPIIIQACKSTNLPLFPYLMAIATSANIGSASLPVGNPQNMIIATASGVKFTLFFKVSIVSSLIGVVINTALLYLYFRKELSRHQLNSTTPAIAELYYSQDLNHKFIEMKEQEEETENIQLPTNIPIDSPSIQVLIDEQQEEEEEEMEINLNHSMNHLSNSRGSVTGIHIDNIKKNKNRIETIKDQLKYGFILIDRYKAGWISILILVGFFVGFHMGFTVMMGVSILILLERRDITEVLKSVDWELLVFFGGLFILVDGFDREFSSYAWDLVEPWVPLTPNALKIFIFTVMVMICSNILGNVPLVLALCPRFLEASAPPFTWLLLAFVSTVAGNLIVSVGVPLVVLLSNL
ncbi:arsenite transport subunit B [Cavenderia fasciculata]|uniref:Arsenite transport subunit B n=1 Tax=Cavenderia fasciculata TaxID=261658 RepID=F4PSE5_CACFS|nr:arsenite transport subunit B [Cavenderia fasciculata]EGG21475.1 arsenite transport subunit B [Cavenderia fasciculata]|eukprot:XP_004359325.1 arsenite transport subunit B [Cavenderia fasciculata]